MSYVDYRYTLFYCTLQIVHFFFFLDKLKVCDNPESSKSIGAIFPTAFAHCVSVSHFGNSPSISVFHYYICHGDL